ncbi:MAG: dimethyl sulfoxide reductase anchor subunit [Alphaproteobacteria bacterium]|nr:dimethyl sulfoxide reductase anchor subunit [Alphaproteobacteria bacterium]
MHPAFSVIFFTTASGAGYGLLALAGILAPLGLMPTDQRIGTIVLGIAIGLITAGLLSSTLHLGHPERAWRAFSQWRSSWLSREGVFAVVAYGPIAVFAFGWIFQARLDGAIAWAGLACTVLAIVTVYCTAMIYRSLKPVHQWCNALVVPNYLALALMTGALWLAALLSLAGSKNALAAVIALAATALAAWLKTRYWAFIDATQAASTPESATGLGGGGLGAGGKVRLFEAPSTGASYLMNEMGYRIARKHAARLRRIALVAGFALPLVLTLLGLLVPGAAGAASALAAALLAMAGVLVERWLFFAEAKHTVTLYYGATSA